MAITIHKSKYIFAISCLLLFVSLSILADEASIETQELKKLERDRNRTKQQKKTVLTKEKGVLTELNKIDKDLAAREEELRIYRHNLARCEKEIRQLEEALEEAESRSRQTQAQMIKRLRSMYKFGYRGGQISYLKLLLDAESIYDVTTRYKYMSAIAMGDKELLDKAMVEKEEIEFNKEQMEDRKERILKYQASAKKIKDSILRKKGIRQETLEELRNSKERLTQTLNELDIAVREKERLIARLRAGSTEEFYGDIADLGKLRGKLPWPVSGKVVKNAAASMKGITIQARYGANIRCVSSGTVEYAQWFDGVGFGQMVIVGHGNGYRTLYAHASELLVKKGQKIKAGHVIARVGDSGSLSGPILYFEIWKGTKAMITRQWLK